MARRIGMLIFPRLTQLDMTGPYEVLARLPDTTVELVARSLAPVTTDRGMLIVPTTTYADCPPLEVIMVPGGPGQQDLMENEEALAFLRRQAEGAQFITSVCTGSLVLGAAGLLRGRRATCHWAAIDHLTLLGAVPVHERVVFDGNIVTGAGVASGIDFALQLAVILDGEQIAREIQLQIEYDPAPPFTSGSPQTAAPETLAALRTRLARLNEERRTVAARVGEKLGVAPAPATQPWPPPVRDQLGETAGDAFAGGPGRVALVVIGAFMNDDRGPVAVENRIGLAFLQRDCRVHDLDGQFAAGRRMDVGHVAGVMALRHHDAVLLAGRVEVAAGRGERRLAFADRVDVKGMGAGGQPLGRQGQQHAVRQLGELDRADVVAAGVLQVRAGVLRRRRQGGGREQNGDQAAECH
jgi:cyclohexyl-isocyanide hydratase